METSIIRVIVSYYQ